MCVVRVVRVVRMVRVVRPVFVFVGTAIENRLGNLAVSFAKEAVKMVVTMDRQCFFFVVFCES